MAINNEYFYDALKTAQQKADVARQIQSANQASQTQGDQFSRFVAGLPPYLAAQAENTPEAIQAMTKKVAALRQANPAAFAKFDATSNPNTVGGVGTGAPSGGGNGSVGTVTGSGGGAVGNLDYLTAGGTYDPMGGGGSAAPAPQTSFDPFALWSVGGKALPLGQTPAQAYAAMTPAERAANAIGASPGNAAGVNPSNTIPGGNVVSPRDTTGTVGRTAAPTGLSVGAVRMPNEALTGNPLGGGTAFAPGANASTGLPYAGLSDIANFLSRNPDTSEWDTTSAERAVAGGYGGSRMAAAEGSLLRQSEIDKRNETGLKLLEPYLQRQQDTWTTIEKGRQAADLLAKQEAGLNTRLSSSQAADLRKIAAEGENALRIALLNAQTSRENARLGASSSLQNSQLSNSGANYRAELAANARQQSSTISPQAQAIIDQILRGSSTSHSTPTASTIPGGSSYDPLDPEGFDWNRSVNQEYDPLNPEGYDWENEYA